MATGETALEVVDRGLPEPLTYTPTQAAAAIGIGIVATRRLIRIGELAHFMQGRHIKVPIRAVEIYIERKAFGTDSDGR